MYVCIPSILRNVGQSVRKNNILSWTQSSYKLKRLLKVIQDVTSVYCY